MGRFRHLLNVHPRLHPTAHAVLTHLRDRATGRIRGIMTRFGSETETDLTEMTKSGETARRLYRAFGPFDAQNQLCLAQSCVLLRQKHPGQVR